MKERVWIGAMALVALLVALTNRSEPVAPSDPPAPVEIEQADRPLADYSSEDDSESSSELPGQLPDLSSEAEEDDPAPFASYDSLGSLYAESDSPPREFDEMRARDDARREMARRGYRGFCTQDCGGHEAGYQWAHQNRLTRPGYTDDSQSFDEGQEAYVRDVKRRVEEKRQEFETNPDLSEYAN